MSSTIPWYKKANPLWWFGNDTEQKVSEAPWYHPEWPEWKRKLFWNFRNPLQNFRAFVIGVKYRDFETVVVKGNPNPNVIQRNDVGELGYQVAYLKLESGVRLPFISYSGKKLVWYAGWQPGTGFFGLKLNITSPGGFNKNG